MKTAEIKVLIRQSIRELRRFTKGQKSSPSTEVLIDKLWKYYESYNLYSAGEEVSAEDDPEITHEAHEMRNWLHYPVVLEGEEVYVECDIHECTHFAEIKEDYHDVVQDRDVIQLKKLTHHRG